MRTSGWDAWMRTSPNISIPFLFCFFFRSSRSTFCNSLFTEQWCRCAMNDVKGDERLRILLYGFHFKIIVQKYISIVRNQFHFVQNWNSLDRNWTYRGVHMNSIRLIKYKWHSVYNPKHKRHSPSKRYVYKIYSMVHNIIDAQFN